MDEDFDKALGDIVEWMGDHGAGAIAENLRGGASDAELAEVEGRLGKRFPVGLRRLYGLHGGQVNRDEHWFFEVGRFADLEYGEIVRDRMLDSLWHDGETGRTEDVARRMAESARPLVAAECNSAWWPLAEGEGAYLAVHLDTGRVFEVVEEGPQILFRADDVTALLCDYADGLWNDLYEVAGDPALDGVTAEGFVSLKRHIRRV